MPLEDSEAEPWLQTQRKWHGEIAHGAEMNLSDLKWLSASPCHLSSQAPKITAQFCLLTKHSPANRNQSMERLSHYLDWSFCPLIYPEPSYRCPCWSGLLIANPSLPLQPFPQIGAPELTWTSAAASHCALHLSAST